MHDVYVLYDGSFNNDRPSCCTCTDGDVATNLVTSVVIGTATHRGHACPLDSVHHSSLVRSHFFALPNDTDQRCRGRCGVFCCRKRRVFYSTRRHVFCCCRRDVSSGTRRYVFYCRHVFCCKRLRRLLLQMKTCLLLPQQYCIEQTMCSLLL